MLDDTDLEILDYLRENGRASFSEIADEMDLATSTVAGRVEKMEDEEIISGYRPVIDYEKLGFNLTAMINVKADPSKIQSLSSDLKSRGRVISFFEVTGETDMILVSRFMNRQDMNSFIKSLQTLDGLNSTETKVILTTPKFEDNMELGEFKDSII